VRTAVDLHTKTRLMSRYETQCAMKREVKQQAAPNLQKPYPELMCFRDAMSSIALVHKKTISADTIRQIENAMNPTSFITTKSTLRPYGVEVTVHMGHRGRGRRLGHGACHFLSVRVRYPSSHRIAPHAVTKCTKLQYGWMSGSFHGQRKGLSRESK
jgi:hypothetical protein